MTSGAIQIVPKANVAAKSKTRLHLLEKGHQPWLGGLGKERAKTRLEHEAQAKLDLPLHAQTVNTCAVARVGSLLVELWDGSQWTINPTPTIGNGEIPASILALPFGDVFVSTTVSSNGVFAGTLVLHGKEAK